MAISDVGTKLYAKGASTTYDHLIDITSAPATGAAPGTIDITTLSDTRMKYLLDRPDTPAYEFEYLYTSDDYAAVEAKISLTTDKDYLMVYQDGSGVKFTGRGAQWIKEVTPGNAVKVGLSFAVTTMPEHVADTATLITTP